MTIKMPSTHSEPLERFLAQADAFIESRADEWDVSDGETAYECVNHLLRVWIQTGRVGEKRAVFKAMVDLQRRDGGWGNSPSEQMSHVRVSAFTTQMLIRGNRELEDSSVADAAESGIQFLLGAQESDGSWRDRKWPTLDATSVPLGTLLFVAASDPADSDTAAAVERAMAFILGARSEDTLWFHKPTASPVEITSHLLQKCAVFGADEDEVILPATKGLLALQSPRGDWDAEDVDSTCDAARCLMLVAETLRDRSVVEEIAAAAAAAIVWLVELSKESDGGLGVRPGRTPSVLFTCDAIDTVLKYQVATEPTATLRPYYE
jgi:hypothetical protein